LAEFSVLDGRQYRSREACYGPPSKGGGHAETVDSCPELLDVRRSMLGETQEAWLFDGLAKSQARWNVIAQNVLMAQLHEHRADGSVGIWTEAWDGYPAARTRLLNHIHQSEVANPVVIGGDNHAFWSNDLKLDFDDLKSPVVASEFVGSSITSHGPPFDLISKWLPDNPHLRFFESRRRGYVTVDLTRKRMTARMCAISDPLDPAATVSTLKTFVVEDGCRGAAAA
jgi:alkaline phosphatase D